MPYPIQSAEISLITRKERYALVMSFENGEGADLAQGEEVYVNDDFEVSKRDLGTDFPIGVVLKGASNGEQVTVLTNFSATGPAIIKTSATTAGSFVKPNGTLETDGRPQYIAAVANDYAQAIVLDGGSADQEIIIAHLRHPVKI